MTELRSVAVDSLRRYRLLRAVLGAILLCLGASVAQAADANAAGEPPMSEDTAAADVELSEAETLLWMTDQLESVAAPVKLVYRFEKSGSLEPGFTDTVVFVIDRVRDDGMKSASLEFFTGERNVPVPPAEETNVNPVIKVFFQGDVYEMTRLTDPDGGASGRWRYFQRRIKFALAEAAEVRPVSFELDGKQYAGQEVVFAPYVEDPHRAQFERFAGKRYAVIVSDTLPGYLYRIETTVPAEVAGAPPLIRETLVLERIEPL